MATLAFKPTNEALAFITLYKTMTPEVKEEVKEMIIKESDDEETDTLTALSFASWDSEDEHVEEESKLWEKFYQEQKGV